MKSPFEGRDEHGVLVAFAGPSDAGCGTDGERPGAGVVSPASGRWVVRVVRAG